MKISGLVILGILASSVSVSFAADVDPCATNLAPAKDVLAAVQRGGANETPDLIPTTRILPAGDSVDLVLQRDFDSQTTYKAIIIEGTTAALLSGSQVAAKRPDDALVKNGVASPGSTVLTLQVPATLGSFWSPATTYVYGCKAGTVSVVSSITLPVSAGLYSGAIVWSFLVLAYVLVAYAAQVVDEQQLKFLRYLDPVVLTAGSNGKGNLAKLQILFFSMIVAGLVAFIVCRTGILSDLSSTILMLLGIAGVGSAAAKATDVSRNRLDFENWAWFVRKGWLPEGGLAAINNARWRDLVTTDGEFDVYHFQNLIFSFVVGGALVIDGLRDLESFSIPQALLGVLGLSQVVYIGGKLVTPPSCSELNVATTALRQLERDFVAAAVNTPDPAPPAGVAAANLPADLNAAIRRAGNAKYAGYMDSARGVRTMFQAVMGTQVDEKKLAPAFAP